MSNKVFIANVRSFFEQTSYVEEDSGDRHLFPLGNLEGGSFTRDFERWVSLRSGPIGKPGESGPSTGNFEN
jgi:hypothetical protein